MTEIFLLELCVMLWTFFVFQFEATATLKGHSATVTMATGIYVPGGLPDCMRTLVATTSADSSVRVWQRMARDGG